MERLNGKWVVWIENEPFKLKTERLNKKRYTNRTFNILNLNQANVIPTHTISSFSKENEILTFQSTNLSFEYTKSQHYQTNVSIHNAYL